MYQLDSSDNLPWNYYFVQLLLWIFGHFKISSLKTIYFRIFIALSTASVFTACWDWTQVRKKLVAQLCPTLRDAMDCNLPGPLSTEFSRQEYWSGFSFPSPGELPKPGIKPRSPAFQADSLPSTPPEKQSCKWDFELLKIPQASSMSLIRIWCMISVRWTLHKARFIF